MNTQHTTRQHRLHTNIKITHMTLIEMHLNIITCRTNEYAVLNLDLIEGSILPSNSPDTRAGTAEKVDDFL